MIKKLLFTLLASVIALLPLTPVLAGEPKQERQIGEKRALSTGDEATYLGSQNGKEIWQAKIGDPVYVKGTNIKYDCQWYQDGLTGYKAGANDFTATVSGTNVVINYKDNMQSWSPETAIGTTKLSEKTYTPTLLVFDPINFNYYHNTLMWDYGNGVKRYLRIIEGMLIEYYQIEKPIAGDFNIDSKLVQSDGYIWNRPMAAWDADNKPVDVTILSKGKYSLSSSKQAITKTGTEVKYPITIDPDSTFYTSSSDASLIIPIALQAWNTIHNAASSNSVDSTSGSCYVETQSTGSNTWNEIVRAVLYFNTSSLPDSATITATNLYLNVYTIGDGSDGGIYIVNGMDTYPHDPCVVGDYDYTKYASFASNYGYADIGDNITDDQYNLINAKAGTFALSTIINKTGYTKLMLVERDDYNNSLPPNNTNTSLFWYAYEQGVGYRPYIVVTYAVEAPEITGDAASNISTVSARLNSTVDFDGYESCQVRFGYGLVSKLAANFATYDNITAWSAAEWDTGEHPFFDTSGIADLVPATTYYYRVQIKNSDSTVTSDPEISFATEAALNEPDNLRGIPSMTSISLSWTKGTGASQTEVVFSSTGLPTSNTTGTIIYLNTGTTYTYTGLVAGHTYYFSAWGESAGAYSASYATLAVTTSAFTVESEDIETPPLFTEWFQTPDYTQLSNLEPLYSAVNGVATALGTPTNNAWMGLITLIIVLVSLGIMMFAGWFGGFVIGVFLTLGGVAIHILPAWYVFILILVFLFAWQFSKRGVENG
jgi:hypothetical protein